MADFSENNVKNIIADQTDVCKNARNALIKDALAKLKDSRENSRIKSYNYTIGCLLSNPKDSNDFEPAQIDEKDLEEVEKMRKQILDNYEFLKNSAPEKWEKLQKGILSMSKEDLHLCFFEENRKKMPCLGAYLGNVAIGGPNGKVDANVQRLKGNCDFLAAVNTFIDREGGLNDVIKINLDDMSADVKFHIGKDEDKIIHVTSTEYNLPFYKIISLSGGDTDVKILEIAYYKYMEEKGVPLTKLWAEPIDGNEALRLLYPPDKYTFKKALTGYRAPMSNDFIKESRELNKKWQNGEYSNKQFNELHNKLVEKYRQPQAILLEDLSRYNGFPAKTSVPKPDENFKKELLKRANILINNGYDKNEVMEAVKKIADPDFFTRFKNLLITPNTHLYHVPAKDGIFNAIVAHHAYTFVSAENGTVKLRNPWINQEIIEIPEIYFKLLFTHIDYMEPINKEK